MCRASGPLLVSVGELALAELAIALAVAVPLAARALDAIAPSPRVVPELTSGPVQVLPPVLDGQRVSGTAFIGYRGEDGQTTGAVATVSPWWLSFVRVGAEVTPRSKDGGDVRLLWGLGFESWRDRTFFLHVHDWGPVRPDEPFTLRHAEASLGYKLPRLCGGPFCLAPSAFATLPFDGGPYLGARTTVMLWSWFASGGARLDDPRRAPGLTARRPPGACRSRSAAGTGGRAASSSRTGTRWSSIGSARGTPTSGRGTASSPRA